MPLVMARCDFFQSELCSHSTGIGTGSVIWCSTCLSTNETVNLLLFKEAWRGRDFPLYFLADRQSGTCVVCLLPTAYFPANPKNIPDDKTGDFVLQLSMLQSSWTRARTLSARLKCLPNGDVKQQL
jgi:hypothetical protein